MGVVASFLVPRASSKKEQKKRNPLQEAKEVRHGSNDPARSTRSGIPLAKKKKTKRKGERKGANAVRNDAGQNLNVGAISRRVSVSLFPLSAERKRLRSGKPYAVVAADVEVLQNRPPDGERAHFWDGERRRR